MTYISYKITSDKTLIKRYIQIKIIVIDVKYEIFNTVLKRSFLLAYFFHIDILNETKFTHEIPLHP
ncbi:hypothetical protein GCM10028895_33440 [Pontibacter rugosus]